MSPTPSELITLLESDVQKLTEDVQKLTEECSDLRYRKARLYGQVIDAYRIMENLQSLAKAPARVETRNGDIVDMCYAKDILEILES